MCRSCTSRKQLTLLEAILPPNREPFREIALLAGQTQSELLVLGTRGRGAAHHALIGSVALKAAAASDVPVLLVK